MPNMHTRHSLFEKIYFRSMILGSYGIGAYAIYRQNIWAAALYVVFILLSLEFVVCRFCSHCPYPCQYGTCLMMPYQKVTKYVRPDQKPMTPMDRMLFPLVMIILLPLIPQYWLWKRPSLLLIFWIVFITAWSSMLFFKCRHCRFKQCPLNMRKEKLT